MKKVLFILNLLVLIASVFVSSCNKTMYDLKDQSSTFLDVEFTDIASLTEADWKVITEAACRMGFYVEEGIMKTDIDKASDINVSQSMFSILQDVMHAANVTKVFCLPEYATRSDGEPTYDCVAVSLAQWGDYSYYVIQTWITNQFGDKGVPIKELNRTVHHFYPNALGLDPKVSIPPDINWDASKTIGIFSVGNGYGHMSNIVGKHDTTFFFRDGNDTTEYIMPLSKVGYIYYNLPTIDTIMAKVSVDALRRSIVR